MSELLKINVNEHTEKKNGLTYLSWAWAWAEVLKVDPAASWTPDLFKTAEGVEMPCMFLPDGTAMVSVHVQINGNHKGAVLPVMNHKNQAIQNPNAFQINTAIQRCLAKAIAMHGLGLYIYAGEDLPEGEEPNSLKAQLEASIEAAQTRPINAAELSFQSLQPEVQDSFRRAAPFIHAAMPDCDKAHALIDMALDNWPEEDRNNLKAGLWHLLDSKTRSALKRHAQIKALKGVPAEAA